jgi:GTP pyrophosphokinase
MLPPLPDGGGRLVAELVCAFNELTERMGEDLATFSSSSLLFRVLKLALPALRDVEGGRALARALAVAATLADLQVTYHSRMPPPLFHFWCKGSSL